MSALAIAAVRRLAPELLDGRSSTATVCTTQPKHLVFGRDASTPTCVVAFGAKASLEPVHAVLSALHPAVPSLVPRSVALAQWDGEVWVHLQEGMPGLPWFRSGEHVTSHKAWTQLLTRAARAEADLRHAVAVVPGWQREVSLGVELDGLARGLEGAGVSLPPQLVPAMARWRAQAQRDTWTHPRQHGDFSLNNLLVSSERVAVIDFEEFGQTAMPLHDALGLALSVPLTNTSCPVPLADVIRLCLADGYAQAGVTFAQLPACLMHHLLWRVRQCQSRPRRAALREILLGWVRQLLESPDDFFPPRDWGASA